MDKTYLPILDRLLDNQESDELEQQQLLQEFQDIGQTRSAIGWIHSGQFLAFQIIEICL
ncbi:hypothetical protein BDW69DRAFT_181633 [Aspergillus filifer]